MSQQHLTNTLFRNLELSDVILEGLDKAGFTRCTPIQDKTLPLTLRGKNIAGQAQTGTGKTASFLLATFQQLINSTKDSTKQNPRAIILAPTRELAIQISKDANLLSTELDIKFSLCYGGTDYKQQLQQVKSNVDIIIGTPGRIIDFYKQKAFSLKYIEVAVLDEADRMLDLGFINDIRFLLRQMPKPEERLNLLFSATLSYRVTELAYEHMNNPELIRIDPEQISAGAIQHTAYCPSNEQKIKLLIGILRQHKPTRSIVFINTKRAAEKVNAYLKHNDIQAAVLSGDVPQQKREKLLESFQLNKLDILIATDVAARGLHIPDVTHVINFDLPQDVEDYVHRTGRTARFGAEGEAISFICEEFAYSMPEIEEFIGQKIPTIAITSDLLPEISEPTFIKRPARKPTQQRRQHPSKNKNSSRPRKPYPSSSNSSP